MASIQNMSLVHPLSEAARGVPLWVGCLLLLVLCGPCHAQREAKASWWDRTQPVSSRHYMIRSDLPREDSIALANHLDTMYMEYSRRLSTLQQRAPEALNVMMFASRDDYQRTLRTRFGIDGTGSGGMFFVTPKATALAFYTENVPFSRILHVIQHEAWHQYAYSRFGNDLPIWVNEGLAEYFGEAAVVGRSVILGQTTDHVLERVRKSISNGTAIRFHDLLTMSGDRWNRNVRLGNASIQYAQSWSMVHFLVHADDGRYRSRFEQYLVRLNKGQESESAFIEAFGTNDLVAFERSWAEYAMACRPSSFVTAMQNIEFMAEGLLELDRAGIRPGSMEELAGMLKEIGFKFTIDRHGYSLEMSAEDPSCFVIPDDDLDRRVPRFEFVADPARRRQTRKEQLLEQANPMPPIIRSVKLSPRNLQLRWIRNEDNTGFIWHVDFTSK
ncbi:MAG: hypothetical protein CMJ32_11090 [Phycisphaerae bacterium]|nr:hypothetical protein [Phycisphaerae bacterium]